MPAREQAVLEWLRHRAAADAPMRAAARERDAAPGEPDKEDTDITSVLTRQHDRVTALLQQVKAIPGVSKGGSAEQQAERASIIDMITVALSEHEAAEEEQFWPWVRSVLDDGGDLAGAASGQEQKGKDLLTALGKTEASEERFDELAEELDKACRKHVAFEDRVLLRLRAAASREDREAAGARFLRAQEPGAKRHAPKPPKAAGAADRGRDKAGDRPAQRRGQAASKAAARAPDRTDGDKTTDGDKSKG
jgi:hypothetical protein